MRRWLLVGGCVGALVAPAGAAAAGGPVLPLQGGPGVTVPASAARYIAVGAGHETIVEQVLRGAGGVARTRALDGAWGVPGITYDNDTTGLSADGRTLVLADITARYPIRRTRLAVLDAHSLRVVQRITFHGWYTVDAISPDGGSLYLVHYLRQDGARYEVRAYDLAHRRLVAAPIVDPREPDEKMQGIPVRRAMSPDGRFAYTLYQGFDGPPFIHALDTVKGSAACIDVPALANGNLSEARLTPRAGRGPLVVRVGRGAPVAVDVATRRVRTLPAPRPAAAAAPAPAHRSPAPDNRSALSGLAPVLAALAAAAMLVGAPTAVARRRRRDDRAVTEVEIPA
jgi:hypothetical protein